MKDNFDLKSWIYSNRVGPYAKDNAKYGKRRINESMEEALDLTPPSPENVYEPEESEQDYYDRAMGLVGLQVKDVIDTLRNDGFDDEEIEDIFKTLLMDYDTAFSGIDEASHNLTEQPYGETYYSVAWAMVALEDAGDAEDVMHDLLSIRPSYRIGKDKYHVYVKGSEIEDKLGAHVKEFLDNVATEYEDLAVSEKSLVRKGAVPLSGIDEGESLNESERDCVKKSDGYYIVDDEHNKVSGPYHDSNCTRRKR